MRTLALFPAPEARSSLEWILDATEALFRVFDKLHRVSHLSSSCCLALSSPARAGSTRPDQESARAVLPRPALTQRRRTHPVPLPHANLAAFAELSGGFLG